MTGLDRLGVPVYQAVRPAALSLSVSQGKGATPEAARVSAAMEAIELWHAERLDDLPQVVMTPREMRYANPIPDAALLWDAAEPRRFAGVPLAWLRAEPLGGGGPGWLPRAQLELDLRPPEPFAPRPFHVSSNGLAAGNCREEALLHGLCELIERHALDLAQADPGRRVPLDVASLAPGLAPEHCREIAARVRAAGGKLRICDVTCEIAVPAVFVEMAFPDLPRVWIGSGCHPSPAVALSRALTEAAQSRLTYIAGARDDIVRPSPWQALRPWSAWERFAEPAPRRPPGGGIAAAGFAGETVAADLAGVVERLIAQGFTPYAVDLTRPGIGIPVVRAFVGGLREAHRA